MKRISALLTILLVGMSAGSLARGVYQQPEEFIHEAFAGGVPKPKVLWLTKEMEPEIMGILGHEYPSLRIRYWGQPGRTVWVLEEIGKTEPITTGIIINRGKIEMVKVLIFRESRGWEVRYPFFTDQFKKAGLRGDKRLDREIDGITGASLSVDALTRLARLALYFHQYIEASR
jgi:hypothetical protein